MTSCRCFRAVAVLAATAAVTTAWVPRRLSALTRYRSRAHVSPRMALGGNPALDDLNDWLVQEGLGEITQVKELGGSGWAMFRRVSTSNGPDLFVKTSTRKAEAMFAGEALSLTAMYDATQEAGLLTIPKVYHYADRSDGKGSFLAMEFLSLGGRGDAAELGRAMASMHASCDETRFGFAMDNTIGGTPQINTWCDDWIEFYRDRRLGYQIQLAGDSYTSKLFDEIAPRLGDLFEGVEVRPSVLHGDFWSGNIGTASGQPTIYDPATYFGHHEAEWGMSWCAGLGPAFWSGYREMIPEDPGFKERRPLYDAYHYLNHYNLFGGGYLNQACSSLEQVKRALF